MDDGCKKKKIDALGPTLAVRQAVQVQIQTATYGGLKPYEYFETASSYKKVNA